MAFRRKTLRNRSGRATKVADVEYHFRCSSGTEAIYREVYVDSLNRVFKYSLAFLHFGICQVDHGLVVGYDNAHGYHERHFMGDVEIVGFISYEGTLKRFQAEVRHGRETA